MKDNADKKFDKTFEQNYLQRWNANSNQSFGKQTLILLLFRHLITAKHLAKTNYQQKIKEKLKNLWNCINYFSEKYPQWPSMPLLGAKSKKISPNKAKN